MRTQNKGRANTRQRKRASELGGSGKDTFTLTLMLMHTAETDTIGEKKKQEEKKKNIRKKYLPLKNHFTSPSGIFVRPHDKTIDLFSMASTVSAAIVAGLVLNSSSSIASVLFRVFYFPHTKPPETEERRREEKSEKFNEERVKDRGKDTMTDGSNNNE